MRRAAVLALALCALAGCSRAPRKFTATYYGMFDTYVTITGYCESEAVFREAAGEAEALLRRLHCVFDAYGAYEGVAGLRALNDRAANGPVEVEPELFDLLRWCKEEAPAYGDRVNVAMGAVLSLWHDSRETALSDPQNASLPEAEALSEAARHGSMEDIVLDARERTVYFADPLLRVDLGAVAKGWAADAAAALLRASAMPSFLLNLGGNVVAGEKPLDGREAWNVSVADPNAAEDGGMLELLRVSGLSVVTSGDYQRYFECDGVRYHHIIDPDTLESARYLRAATVAAESSALADWLSTTLMLMPYETGRRWIESIEGAEALWVLNDGSVRMTSGMAALSRSGGAET